MAQRRASARLLVLGTYRPVEAAIQQHPLRHRWWEAELHRLKGALLLQLVVPEVQQAKALELRAALSLSRLWQ